MNTHTEDGFLADYDITAFPQWSRTADVAALTIRDTRLCVLLVERGEHPYRGAWALPGGFVPPGESSLDAAHRELADETGVTALPDGTHLEQLATYDTPGRDPRGPVATTAYVCLAADLPDPVAGSDAVAARWWPVDDVSPAGGVELAFDHATILDDAVDRARGRIEYTTLASSFLPDRFTMADLRRVYECVWNVSLDPSNFARKALAVDGWLTETDDAPAPTRGRPATVYRAESRVLRISPPLERPR